MSSPADVPSPPEGQLSFSGIPASTFVEDVDDHMKGEESAEERLKLLDEQHQKYKFMESSLVSRRRRLKAQIPDISASLAMIGKLKEKRQTEAHFLLSEQVYAKAVVPPTEKVRRRRRRRSLLWLITMNDKLFCRRSRSASGWART